MSRRYWNSHEKRAPDRWDASPENQIERDLEEYLEGGDSVHWKRADDGSRKGRYRGTTHEGDTGECPICLGIGPVLRVGKKCWHQAACRKCLRTYLVTKAQTGVENYPLKCFHPQCDAQIRGEQLENLGLFLKETEKARHYLLCALAKRKRAGDNLRLIHCPACDHPRTFSTQKTGRELTFCCRSCRAGFSFSPDFYTLQTLHRLKKDNVGPNNGYGYCPGCGILISKGQGGDSMVCFCGKEFLWNEAQEKMQQKRLGRIPYEEIPYWW